MQHFPSHQVAVVRVRNLYFVVIFRTASVLWEKRPLCAPAAAEQEPDILAFECDSINHENALVCPQVGHLPGCPGGRRTRCSTTPPSPSTTVASRMYCVWENWNADIYIPSTHARRLITIFQPPSPARYPSTSTVSTISFSILCGASLLWVSARTPNFSQEKCAYTRFLFLSLRVTTIGIYSIWDHKKRF